MTDADCASVAFLIAKKNGVNLLLELKVRHMENKFLLK